MSSASLVEGPAGIFASWETEGQIYFGRVDMDSSAVLHTRPAPGEAKGRKHPAISINQRGELVLAWSEGTGWSKGGALVWQLFDRDGKAVGSTRTVSDGIPTWSLPTAAARPDGSFLIIH